MEILKIVQELISALIWPVTILVILHWFKKPLISVFSGLTSPHSNVGRNIKLKMGQFEIESNIQEKVQQKLEEIAEEQSLEKRLEMAKTPFLVNSAIQEIDSASMEALENIYKRRLKNAALINWYEPFDGIKPETYSKLAKLGLIQGAQMFDGDEVAWITPVGLEVIERVGKQKQANKTIQPTATVASAPSASADD